MFIKRISLENKSDLEFIEKLYIESFPAEERRSVLKMHRLIDENDAFHVCILTNAENLRTGLLTYWTFDTFIYLEHFAINSELRSEGYGEKAIKALINKISLPIVGEIELPSSSDLATRRLNFYKRLGFQAWDLPYEQPPYEEGYNSVPMLLLTYGAIDMEKEYKEVVGLLYKNVYNNKSM